MKDISKHLLSDQMTIITGPRQVGKTFLMQVLRDKLVSEGEKTVWFNLDIEKNSKIFSSQGNLVTHIELKLGNKKGYVFIDEIQRKKNAGLFLKGIYDMNLPYKFIISGSGSMELKADISESMAGRKQMFKLNPITFREFINFKTKYQFEDRLDKYFSVETDEVVRYFSEYMVYGGYPKVVLADDIEQKINEMEDIFESYIERDIKNILHLEKSEAFYKLLKILASQIGCIVNFSELSTTLELDERTVKKYIWYLEETYIVRKVTPFYRNTRKEITKAPIFYFVDQGFRNWLLELFGLSEIPIPLSGHLFENIVYNMLLEKYLHSSAHVHFWRTKDNAEVDFVSEIGLDIIPIEAKHKNLNKPEVGRSYRNFIAKYSPKVGYIINLGKRQEDQIENTKIIFAPFYQLKDLDEK